LMPLKRHRLKKKRRQFNKYRSDEESMFIHF